MENNKKKTLAIVLSIFAITIVIGATYAFVTKTLTGSKKVTITAGTLSLVLDEKNEITISDALPMYDVVGMIQEEVFNFDLINETSNPTDYTIKLKKVSTGNELSESDVKYYLTKEGVGEPKLLSSLTDGVVDTGTITGGDTIEYSLRLWINEDVTDKNAIAGKSLSYKLEIVASMAEIKVPSFVDTLEEKVDTASTINFAKASSATNGRGIYKYTEDGEDIYYWRGKVDEVEGAANHLLFANLCWEIVRTTKTGGVKIIYDGTPVEVDGVKTCPNTGEASQLSSTSAFNSSSNSPAYVGYMYGNTVYKYQTKTSSDAALTTAEILYGYDVEWTGTEYELKAKDGGSLFSSTGTWSTDRTSVGNGNHYTCFDSDGKCETVSYVYYTGSSSYPYYIDLSGGTTIEKALEQMYSNEQPSTIKATLETWFESTDLDEEENLSKLEDVVYCNDRSVTNTNNGWSKDGDASKTMHYSSYTRRSNGTPDLSCNSALNNRDRFTYKDTVNGNGLLKWPVGLLTSDEIILAGGQNSSNSDYYLYTGQTYRAFSPCFFNGTDAVEFDVTVFGHLSSDVVYASSGVRPVVSLAAGTEITGLGTANSPFEVKSQ